MDNSKSFSLQFNPLMNVKCVKDYEEEIAQLKAENFELKTQLTHANIPKVLYENKQEIDVLLHQKQELETSLGNIRRAYEQLVQDRKIMESKYSQDVALFSEKNSLLEDENKRLLLRLEKLNKDIQDTNTLKTELMKSTNDLNSFRETIQNLERQNEQNRYDFEQQVEIMKGEFNNFRQKAEEEIKSKNFEVENLRKKLEMATQKEKNASFIISDLKATLNAQMKEKSMIEEQKTTERTLLEEFRLQKENAESKLKLNQEILEKIQKDHTVYLNGMEKFRMLILQKLADISNKLIGVQEKFTNLKTFCYVSEENRNLLSKLRIKHVNLNDIILFFKEKHAELYRKMESMKKDISTGNQKNTIETKTREVIQDFRSQFNEAKNELMICKKYLEKKAAENKALKNENARLLSEAARRNKPFSGLLGIM